MPAKTLMVQGTASNVGKSVIATALCRILKKRGYRVAPFKAQNMSNNSFATRDGGEISRAQVVQAEACGIEPSVLMNPILLKPSTDRKSQVVLLGKSRTMMTAMEYHHYKWKLIPVVQEALDALRQSFDIIVIEGAGSPAEINMKKYDLVNMSVAKMARAPVILVGDIDRGGIFAQLIGTLQLLPQEEKKLVKTFLINKFRGDFKILEPGIQWVEKRTQRPILGVLPYVKSLGIAEEDSAIFDSPSSEKNSKAKSDSSIFIDVIRLPRISNFTDFEALNGEKDVVLRYRDDPDRNFLPDLLIIPGSKSTIGDLKFLYKSGFSEYIKKCVKAGIPILGICGGYQMLGQKIFDPNRVEAEETVCTGLGLLPVTTRFTKDKVTARLKALHLESQIGIQGYEIHMGQIHSLNGARPFFKVTERTSAPVEAYEGAVLDHSLDGNSPIFGTSIHGIFDNPPFRRFFINKIRKLSGLKSLKLPQGPTTDKNSHDIYDQLAEVVEKNIDMEFLGEIIQERLI